MELQALLRRCNYLPGDRVLFLGDLVSKGPSSASCVSLAAELGCLGVRGNHDFEVIRWSHALSAGCDPPQWGTEHYHIAKSLGSTEKKWLESLPWYMSTERHLFVHAGFVSGVRLRRQNPR